MEAMRLGSMVLSAGLPTVTLSQAFETWRRGAVALVEKAVREIGDVEDERLRWAVGEAVFGPEVQPSLKGLLRALRTDPTKLWLEVEPELPSTSVLVYPEGQTWADLVEREEEEEAVLAGGLRVPVSVALPAPRFVRGEQPPTHPTTSRNHGRPPPTARWAPNKAPRVTGRTRRRGRVLEEEIESEEWVEEELDEEEFFWDNFEDSVDSQDYSDGASGE